MELRRSPRGERGLKLLSILAGVFGVTSLPSRGAWVEIEHGADAGADGGSLPSRGAWVEMQAHDFYTTRGWCPTSKKDQLCRMYKSYTGKGRNHLSAHYEQDILDLPETPAERDEKG